jgi:hypothetical protein
VGLSSGVFHQVFPLNPCMHLCFFPLTKHSLAVTNSNHYVYDIHTEGR